MVAETGTSVPHILLLEDDRAHQDLILRGFRDDPEPFRVTVAANLREARQVIGSEPFDLIITDWILPDGKGLDILPRRDGIVTTPLIVMTSFGDERLAVEIMKSGAIDYVVKSTTLFKELPHIARRALRDWENIHARQRAEEAEQDSRKRLSDIIAFLPDAMLAIDNEGRVIAWNGAIEKMTGVSAGDMIGKGDHEYSIPFYGERRPILIDLVLEDDPEIEKKYLYVKRDGQKIISETIIPSMNGGRRACLWGTATPLFDGAGNRVGAIEVIRDITERKQIEEALQAKEHQLFTIFQNISEVLYFLSVEPDNRYRFLSVNPPFLKVTGLTQDQVVGRYVHEVIPEPSLTMVLGKYKQAIGDNTTVTWEEISDYPAGKKYGEVSITPLTDATGRCVNLVGSVHDITERKRVEEAIRDSENRFRDLFNNMGAGVVIYEPLPDGSDFIIRDINRAAERMEKVKKEEIVGKNLLGVFPGVVEFGLFSVFQRVAKSGVAESFPVTFYRDNRISGWRENYVSRLPSGDIVAIYDDVTEKKQAEKALRESEMRYRLLADNISDVLWVLNAGTMKWVYISPSVERLRGYTVDEVFAQSVAEVMTPASYAYAGKVMEDRIQAFLRDESEDTIYFDEIEQTCRDGSTIWTEVSTRFLRNEQSELTIIGVSRDISSRRKVEDALRESEEKFRTVVENVPEIILVHRDGTLLYANKASLQKTGYTQEDILGQSISRFIAPEYHVKVASAVRQRMNDKPLEPYEIDILTKSGARMTVLISGSRIEFAGGPASLNVLTDINERKRTEEALKESETRFRALIQNSSDIIRILDRHGRIVYESPSASRILGYPTGELIGRDPLEYIHADDLERVKKDFLEVLDGKNSGTPTEFRIRKASGEYIWVDSLGTNLLDVPGINGIVITTRPIQQRKEAEHALKQSEEQLRLALEGAGASFWDWNLSTGKTAFSDSFYTMLDYEPGEFAASRDELLARMHPDDRDRVVSDLEQQIAEKRSLCEAEYRFLTRDGNWLWILTRGKITELDERGTPLRFTGVNIDITNRRLMESEIRSLNTVLEQRVKDRTQALLKANEALEEEIAQRQEAEKKLQASYDEKVILLKEIHHRVKNNLQIIASLLNLQSRYIRDESTLAIIRESQNRVKAMALVHEKLYRADDISHISLNDYIKFLSTGLFKFYDARSRGIQFRLDIADVQVDINSAIPLGLILNELISNSLKYAFPEGRTGEISVSVRKDEHILTVLFRDNGIGIPVDFDWRDTQSLGLRLVNTLVDQMDGTIELDRSAGTQFTMVMHEKEQKGSA